MTSKTSQTALVNIATGVTSPHIVNVDQALVVGDKILKKMKGVSGKEFTAWKVDQCTPMTTKMANTGPETSMGILMLHYYFKE